MYASSDNRLTEAGVVSASTIEAAGWGVFFIWVGIAIMANVGWGVGLLGAGAIALGGQVARSLFALRVDWWGVVIGACLVVAGLTRWLDIRLDQLPLSRWLVPGIFVVAGMAMLASIWVRGRKG